MILNYILIMAMVTYLIRMLPMVIFKKKIENRFIKSFYIMFPLPFLELDNTGYFQFNFTVYLPLQEQLLPIVSLREGL